MIEYVDSLISLDERETSITFSEDPASLVEVATFNNRWMRRLEQMGHVPEQVYVYQGRGEAGAQVRCYRDVPRSRLMLPRGKPALTKEQKVAARKRGKALAAAHQKVRTPVEEHASAT